MAPWREIALQRGYRSGFALPLKDENAKVFGVLLIYSSEANAVTPEETRLMEGLAGDLAFGIMVQRARIECKQAEEEQVRLQEQLRQSQKMEAVGLLAGGIAHDFNNMLMAIVSYGGILQMNITEDDPLRPHVDKMLTVVDRAAGLTQSLLAFSRKQVIELRPCNLNNIIRKVEKLLVRIIGEDIEIRTTFREDPLVVTVDSGQIEQVLLNLATNARDAMPHGGLLSIVTESGEMDSEYVKAHGYGDPGSYALLLVTDSGTGMDAATTRRVFEPFFTTKEPGKGTGLGLAVCYGIVKQHDGYINVYSEPGIGTTFRIYLPLFKGDEHADTGQAPQPQPTAGTETILLAEDEAELRKLLKDVLTEFGYTVIEAVDGEDAVRQFTENRERIQLLLLDLIMPKKSGKDVCDEIRKMGSTVRAIFVSGYPQDAIQRKGFLEEECDLIMKPVSPQKLLRKIREVLDRYRGVSGHSRRG
jgi:signal transduction histidine kinase/CheY-like chemotaxis protein